MVILFPSYTTVNVITTNEPITKYTKSIHYFVNGFAPILMTIAHTYYYSKNTTTKTQYAYIISVHLLQFVCYFNNVCDCFLNYSIYLVI